MDRDKVTLQLKWVTQAQFAGYYAAHEKGYYKDGGPGRHAQAGRPRHHAEQVVASGQAEFGIDWLPACCRRATRAATSSTSPRSSPQRG